MITEAHESTTLFDTDPARPMVTNVSHFLLPRVGPRYPNIFITFRYRLVRKTGLFFYEKESDIECHLEPDGWNSTGSFHSPASELQLNMKPGNRVLEFETSVFVKLHDTKISVGAFDSSAEFTPPQKHSRIKIEGYLNTRGLGTVKSILMS